jgi:DEP domain-containing protein 5
VDKSKWYAGHVEFTFQDLYLGRNEMWKLCESLVGQCVYSGQSISFVGSFSAKIRGIYIGNNKVVLSFNLRIISFTYNIQ